MRYMIIVKGNRDTEAGVMPKEDLLAAMASYHEELHKAGVLVDASGLKPTSQGFRVKYSGNKRVVVDGPFTETKELVAGYTIIQVKSKAEALEWAKRFPNPLGEGVETEIEVRAFCEIDDLGAGEAIDRFRDLEKTRANG